MAKLSAYNRTVIAQLKTELTDIDKERYMNRWVIYSILSSGTIMKKEQVRWVPDQDHPLGELHDWGWHKSAKLKPGANIPAFIARQVEKGFERIK